MEIVRGLVGNQPLHKQNILRIKFIREGKKVLLEGPQGAIKTRYDERERNEMKKAFPIWTKNFLSQVFHNLLSVIIKVFFPLYSYLLKIIIAIRKKANSQKPPKTRLFLPNARDRSLDNGLTRRLVAR